MENIILQITVETVKKIIEYYQENGLEAIPQMAEELKKLSDGMAVAMLEAFISSADKALVDAREERMGDGIKIRQSGVSRTLYTALGALTYKRTYFDVKDKREYILDRILGVEAYERVDAGVSARLVNEAAKVSYGRSAEIVAGGQLSRQTVRNKVMNTGEVAHVPCRSANPPESIHIFADEDHVSLQNGKNAIVPLVTVCEGKRGVSEGRSELIEPFHMQGYGIEKASLWEYVYALCNEKYDMSKVGSVYLYGDGAGWIESGLGVFPGATRVLDEFHLKKKLRRLLAGDIGQALAPRARSALAKGDKEKFKETANWIGDVTERLMPDGKELAGRLKAIRDNSSYILTHWEAIRNLKLPGGIGSCTEAMISHVLSERLSRNPMGWSKAGLSKMAMIRVYVMNGGKIEAADVTAGKWEKHKGAVISNIEKYEGIVKKQQEEALKGMKDWGMFECERMIPGKPEGTRVALKLLGKRRKIS
jgi:hypothetical protein